mmetsp:Transcript_24285/g.47127  ORF Transcript_24285/g.47127 Transcript_24285/m.47127 type:complete len:252 (+) Transcript_24285:199-954(+)
MGRILYLLAGAGAGVALSENKELVGQTLFSLLSMAKSAAVTALDVELQGTKLSEVPVLGSVLTYASTMKVDAVMLQQGVDQASAMSKDVVRSVGSKQVVASVPRESSFSGSFVWVGLVLGVGGGGIYLSYDPKARKKAIELSHMLQAYLARSLEESRVLCQRASRDAPIYYQRANREIMDMTKYAKEHVPKLTATVVVEVKRQLSSTEVLVRTHAPRIYHQVRKRCDVCYVEAKSAIIKLSNSLNNKKQDI